VVHGRFGVEINNNPSVGNKKAGDDDLREVARGRSRKAGSTAMTDVCSRRADHDEGFVVMDTPGYAR